MTLTKYEEGSFRELLSIAMPLMLSSFSVMLMLFVDRLLLAHYSTAALTSAVKASTLGWALLFGWVVLANITEVFVAQYHGAKQLNRMGEPVWQMLWLALASLLFFIPMAYWGGEWLYGSSPETEMERIYISWMMLFGPTFAAYGALSGFFVGQGKTKLITILAIVANVINALLDVCLIFGIEGIVPALGIKGAAIATSIGSLFQMSVLLFFFLKRDNRVKFGTGNYYFKPQAFWQCFKIGSPGAVFALVEILGWAIFYNMMTTISQDHITIAGICQSLVILLFFFGEGVSKAATAIVGNLIGAKRTWFIPQVFKSGLKIQLLFLGVMLCLFALFHQILIDQFLPNATPEYIASIEGTLMNCLYASLFYVFFEGVRWLLSGILTAAGDTTFLLIAGSLSVWILLVAPVYFFVVKTQASVEIAIYFWLLFSIGAILIYYGRYISSPWKNKSIITESIST
jgi:multidrug resistance protein, MATE family